jgi:hypothetical protein
MSGMFLAKMSQYFILQFWDSHGIDVAEAPNDLTRAIRKNGLHP